MAKIGEDRRIDSFWRRDDGSWLFTIKYTVRFNDGEGGMFFDDSVKLWERDPSDPDHVSAYLIPETFQAPENGDPILRTKEFTATADQLETEEGKEEIFAWIWLRKSTSSGPADDEQRTPFVEMDPFPPGPSG